MQPSGTWLSRRYVRSIKSRHVWFANWNKALTFSQKRNSFFLNAVTTISLSPVLPLKYMRRWFNIYCHQIERPCPKESVPRNIDCPGCFQCTFSTHSYMLYYHFYLLWQIELCLITVLWLHKMGYDRFFISTKIIYILHWLGPGHMPYELRLENLESDEK